MARPVSWLHRLHEIRRSVNDSVRSHYERDELEKLFELQPRSASSLMAMLPTHQVGSSHVVKREDLARFLNRVNEAEDVPALLAQVKTEKAGKIRSKLRSLVQRDIAEASLDGIPENVILENGRVSVRFETMEQLGKAMLYLALVLQDDGDEFARRYEPVTPAAEIDTGAAEISGMFTELDQMEGRFAHSAKTEKTLNHSDRR